MEGRWWIYHGDCLEVLKRAPDAYFDSVVSDPPAGIDFMHRDWDNDKGGRAQWVGWMTEVMKECLRVLKPGGHILIWAIPRTSHWTATAIEDAGFEVRDICHHHFGQGFPKSQDVGKFIDKLAGAERKIVGVRTYADGTKGHFADANVYGSVADGAAKFDTLPATTEAKTWDGWGTALKPATEHWILARKPLSESSIARNVLQHGTGALNIDGCRVERASDDVPGWHKSGSYGRTGGYLGTDTFKIRDMPPEEVQARCGSKGRWPTNLVLSHSHDCGEECALGCPIAELDRQSGLTKSDSRARKGSGNQKFRSVSQGGGAMSDPSFVGYGDSGGASRFFPTFHYFPKPSRGEREKGLEEMPDSTLNRVNPGGLENEPRFAPVQVKNNHPTVKGVGLMRWLCRLITPPNGLVLDPFCGSGSTGIACMQEGFRFIGIEQDAHYVAIAEKRIAHYEPKEDQDGE